jgi:hypothetical protein
MIKGTTVGELLKIRKLIDQAIDRALSFEEIEDYRASTTVRTLATEIRGRCLKVRALVNRDRSLLEERRSERGSRKRRSSTARGRAHQAKRPAFGGRSLEAGRDKPAVESAETGNQI